MVSNRFRAGLSGVVCTLAQAGLLMIQVAGAPFDELLERTRRAALPAYKYAYFDPIDMAALRARIAHERGVDVELGCFFNDRRGSDREQELSRADDDAGVPSMRWLSTQDAPAVEPLFVHIDDTPGTMRVTVQLDTAYISPTDGEAVLRGMEALALGVVGIPGDQYGESGGLA
jgi:hypothetical protein